MRILPVLLLLALPVAVEAQSDTSVKLVVTLDRPDWRYRTGDSARFTVSLARSGRPIPGALVRVDVAPERMRPLRSDTLDLSSGRTTMASTLSRPGFLRATARAVVAGTTYTSLATAAFDPERIAPSVTAPADFDAFWRTAVADARRTPLEPTMTRLTQRSTPEVDVYLVSFQNHMPGSRLYGMLSVPARPGKYPATLVVPGAGVRPYFPSIATARRGIIHLAIGIHGIPADHDSLIYTELRATALRQYWSYGAEDRDLYYYKRVYVGVVRAGDFLLSHPQWDGVNYVVQGGSQGGGLAIVAGVLDPRVKAIAASYPAMSDQFGYFSGHAGGWPHMFADTTRIRALAEKKETIRYYDVINFARVLRVPGMYAWGFNDVTVPPTSSYATFNTISAPKESIIAPEAGHARTPAQVSAMDAWILKRLGVERP